ncbi:MAG: hypothetical protein HLUCCO16_04905 [Phormidium sp. OSCR]|nr:MAG: hypothetical protein HLUCCO16_04905 [Phormidium sp. OSCR]
MENTYNTECLAPTTQPTQQNLGTRWGSFIPLGGRSSGVPPHLWGNAPGFLYISGGGDRSRLAHPSHNTGEKIDSQPLSQTRQPSLKILHPRKLQQRLRQGLPLRC